MIFVPQGFVWLGIICKFLRQESPDSGWGKKTLLHIIICFRIRGKTAEGHVPSNLENWEPHASLAGITLKCAGWLAQRDMQKNTHAVSIHITMFKSPLTPRDFLTCNLQLCTSKGELWSAVRRNSASSVRSHVNPLYIPSTDESPWSSARLPVPPT